MVFRLFFILLFSENCSKFSSAQLQATVLPPLIYNAYQDSTEFGSFTCVTRNSDDIRWIVDGYAHNDPSLRDKIFVYTESYANRSQHSVIRIPAIPANNRIAEIECRAYSDEPWEVAYSAHTAQFNIQGLLDMPPNATYSSYNATHYLVEWMQPQTLDISNVEPDIENYTVCTYKNNVDPECANATTARLFLPKYFFDQFVFITVWNIVGESNSSAQLVIERCNINDEFSMAGSERRPLSLEFDNDNTTVIKISFTEYDNKSNVSTIDDCLYLYEMNVTQRLSMEVLATVKQYGYNHSIVLKLPLPKNEAYTLNIIRTTHSRQLLLNPINFSTYDLQDVSVSKVGNLLKVTCRFARGATAHRCMLVLESENGVVSLEQHLSLSNNTGCRTTQCSVHTTFNLSTLFIVGNVSLIVSGFEESVLNNVHIREFRIELSDLRTEVMNSTPSNNTTENLITLTTPGNSTDTRITLVMMLSAGVFGGAIGAVCLVGISIVTIRVLLRRLSTKTSAEEVYNDNKHLRLHANEAYSFVIQLRRNEAYETTGKPSVSQEDTGPHLYDEIPLPAQAKEPVYAEIGGN